MFVERLQPRVEFGGGHISSKRRCSWSESSGRINESCDLSGKVERIGAVESGGDCSEA